MPYFQANELLKNPEATVEALLDALEEMAIEYGYIVGMVASKLREESETDLVRTFLIIQALKIRIQQKLN